MPSVVELLAGRQRALGRPLRFDEFLDEALYGASGFYRSGGRAGRRGDFLTSPEVGPLFGAVLARWVRAEFERLGRPPGFTIIEVGAGPGTLARSILLAAPEFVDRYVAVELAPEQRVLHPSGVRSVEQWPDDVDTGVVIANELLDNLPFRLAVHDGEWREACVRVERDGSLVETLAPAPADWSSLLPAAAHGTRIPVQERAGAWVTAARRRLQRGTVVAIDYCTARTAELVGVAWRDWLRTYRGHERGGHYLRAVGEQDITTQVCLDQLPEPTTTRTQAQFLQRWGIDELVEEGGRIWAARSANPDLDALRMRSRVREAEALLDPAGLGGFLVLEWAAIVATKGDRVAT